MKKKKKKKSVMKANEEGGFYKPEHKAKWSNIGYALTVNDDVSDMDHKNAFMIDDPMAKKTGRDLMTENGGIKSSILLMEGILLIIMILIWKKSWLH